MKICNIILVLIFFLSINNIPIYTCFKSATESKQDAIVSLIIFAKSQAELDRENQLRIMTSQNITHIDKYEFANLMKIRKSSNLKKMTENSKNASSNNVKTVISLNITVTENNTKSNKIMKKAQNVNITTKVDNKSINYHTEDNNKTLTNSEKKIQKID